MGQKKVFSLVRCPQFRCQNACKSVAWGGKGVLFREMSSIQECPHRGVPLYMYSVYVHILCMYRVCVCV